MKRAVVTFKRLASKHYFMSLKLYLELVLRPDLNNVFPKRRQPIRVVGVVVVRITIVVDITKVSSAVVVRSRLIPFIIF